MEEKSIKSGKITGIRRYGEDIYIQFETEWILWEIGEEIGGKKEVRKTTLRIGH